METSLHREIKEWYGNAPGARTEVGVQGYRIDAVSSEGELVEVQSGPLGPLRPKLRRLLGEHRIRVVKPVPLTRRIVRRARRDGVDASARLSPKRGSVLDVFDDLIGLTTVFPHANLSVEIWGVDIDEVRVNRKRWPGYMVVDRRLRQLVEKTVLRTANELWTLLPEDMPDPFTTRELAERLERPSAFAQRVAYCLRLTGAARVLGKRGRFPLYSRTTVSETARAGECA